MYTSRNRFATWALNSKDEKIYVTLELNIETFNVEIKIVSSPIDKEWVEKIEKDWIKGENIDFPENTITESRSFTDESILPDSIKIEGKTGAIRQLQNEWSYLLLNTKLFSQFMIELDEMKRKTMELQEYSAELFEEAKSFWEKVLEFRKEREISQQKLAGIKEEVNKIFDHLKNLKEELNKEKDERSARVSAEIEAIIEDAKRKMEENGVLFKGIMDQLIQTKNKLAKEDLRRNVKQALFDKLNQTLDTVRAKRDRVLGDGMESRLNQLQTIYNKVKHSLSLDIKDLEFNKKKLSQTNTRLEEQLREAKIRVLEDKVLEKEERLKELEEKIESLKNKVSKSKHDDKGIKVKIKKAEDNIELVTEETDSSKESLENESSSNESSNPAIVADEPTPLNPEDETAETP